MLKLLTQADLAARTDICPKDKELVEKCVLDFADGNDSPKSQSLRGYLVQLLAENPDSKMRDELPGDAASYVKGWTDAMKLIRESLNQ